MMKSLKLGMISVALASGITGTNVLNAESLFQPASKKFESHSHSEFLKQQNALGEVSVLKMGTHLVTASAKTLEFNLTSELSFTAHKSSASVNGNGSLVWKGTIQTSSALSNKTGLPVIDNSVILVKRDTGITGTVRLDGQLYNIRPLENGKHAIIKVNESLMPEDHPPGSMQILEQKSSFNFEKAIQESAAQQATTSAVANIDVLVAYTAAAKNATTDMQGLIELAVAETNTGYSNSGVNATMTLVHSYQVNYTESNFSTDLSYFRNNNDGRMDEVHGLRDQYGADVAVIITNVSDYCGLASDIGSTSSTAFAAVYHSCATGYYSFGHEVGHLQAARHNPENDPTNSPYAYGHGYQYSSGGWRTIMAYNCSPSCTRINWWSNPNKQRNGAAMGTTSRNDNARVLNITSPTMANFKDGSTPPPPPPTNGKLTNGVAITGQSGAKGAEASYYLDVPSTATSLSFQTSGGTGDADMYVKFGSAPTTSSYDCRPYKNGNAETCTISNIQSGRYYVMVRGYSAYSGLSLVGTFAEDTNTGGTFTKSNIAGARSSWVHYAVQIPSGMSTFTVNMSGGTGDADMYVRQGSQPTTSSYDCRPYKNGNTENCSISNPTSGTWYISIRGYSSYSNTNISAEWKP